MSLKRSSLTGVQQAESACNCKLWTAPWPWFFWTLKLEDWFSWMKLEKKESESKRSELYLSWSWLVGEERLFCICLELVFVDLDMVYVAVKHCFAKYIQEKS